MESFRYKCVLLALPQPVLNGNPQDYGFGYPYIKYCQPHKSRVLGGYRSVFVAAMLTERDPPYSVRGRAGFTSVSTECPMAGKERETSRAIHRTAAHQRSGTAMAGGSSSSGGGGRGAGGGV